MLSIQRTGASIADVIASVRGVPSRMIPYAAATALTRCAKQAQTEDLPAEMRKVFSNPVPTRSTRCASSLPTRTT